MSNELSTQTADALNNTSVSVFGSMQLFEQAQRMVVPLAKSTMVPDQYQNNPANCMVAMEMSHRINKSVLEVMQNMHIVKGNAGWKSEYVIMSINRSGIFKDPLEFEFSEDRQSCYATAVRKSNKKVLKGTTVSMEMAADEGWLQKNGSKWKTMPEQMLMYRAATFFCRVYCPEVLAGVQTQDEIIDIGYEPATKSSTISNINAKADPEFSQQEEGYTNFEEVNDINVNSFENVSEATEDSDLNQGDFVPESNQEEEDDDF